jgi:hypothetical protein
VLYTDYILKSNILQCSFSYILLIVKYGVKILFWMILGEVKELRNGYRETLY